MSSIKTWAVAAATSSMMAFGAILPVKAEPVEYVKVCGLYGVGFYYIPGTDTCMKIGGYTRMETYWNMPGGTVDPTVKHTREESPLTWLGRGFFTIDVRSATQYGVLRSYFAGGWDYVGGAGVTPAMERAFIQWAGFTFGLAQSFFDIFSYGTAHSYSVPLTDGDTGTPGTLLAAYSMQFGNGVTGTLSLEYPRNNVTADATAAVFGVMGAITGDTAGNTLPDVVANLTVEQTWGRWGISGALHNVAGNYYLTPNLVTNGGPSNRWGFAVSTGGQFNMPNGDSLGINAVYSQGASNYAMRAGTNFELYNGNTSVGVGWVVDGIFDGPSLANPAATQIELTTVWSINAAYEHVWNPQWRTSVFGGFVKVDYNNAATTIILSHLPGAAGTTPCGVPVSGAVWPPISFPAGTPNSCTPDFSFWQVGTRTQWNPTPLLDIGLEVVYTHLNSAFKGTFPGQYPFNPSRPAVNTIADQGILTAMARWQRNFYP